MIRWMCERTKRARACRQAVRMAKRERSRDLILNLHFKLTVRTLKSTQAADVGQILREGTPFTLLLSLINGKEGSPPLARAFDIFG